MSRQYNLAVVRKLLLSAFTAKEFHRFCQDHPHLSEVCIRFGEAPRLDDMVDEVMNYARTRALFGELLDAVKMHNPRQYATFEASLLVDDAAEPWPPRTAERVTSSPSRMGTRLWAAGGAVALILAAALLLVILRPGGDKVVPTATNTVAHAAVVSQPAASSTPMGETPTATADLPSVSPTDTATPSPEPATDTATPSPEPSTDAPVAAPVQTAPSPQPCAYPAEGIFADLWQEYRDRLGCPIDEGPRAIQDAEQEFENGHMYWRGDNGRIFVVYERGRYARTFLLRTDKWTGGNTYSCEASPPPDRVQPYSGFGKMWCDLGAANAPIGWGLSDQQGFGPGYGDPVVQDFDLGFIFRDSNGTRNGLAYVCFSQDKTFVHTRY